MNKKISNPVACMDGWSNLNALKPTLQNALMTKPS